MQYRSKKKIDAFQMTDEMRLSPDEWPVWLKAASNRNPGSPSSLWEDRGKLMIGSVAGAVIVPSGWWIWTGPKGLALLSDDEFHADYEEAGE